jgi:hypothetical protein
VPLDSADWTGQALPSGGIAPVALNLEATSDGLAFADLIAAQAGSRILLYMVAAAIVTPFGFAPGGNVVDAPVAVYFEDAADTSNALRLQLGPERRADTLAPPFGWPITVSTRVIVGAVSSWGRVSMIVNALYSRV